MAFGFKKIKRDFLVCERGGGIGFSTVFTSPPKGVIQSL